MNIISYNKEKNEGISIDSLKQPIVFCFKNDDELQLFIETLVTTPVMSKGIRTIALLPPDYNDQNPFTNLLMRLLEASDGFQEGVGFKDPDYVNGVIDDLFKKLSDNN